MNVEDKVIAIIEEQLGLPKGEVLLTSTKESLGMDSIDEIETLMALEEEFDIEINDYQAEKFNTVQDVVDFIKVNKVYNQMSKESYNVAKEILREKYDGKTIHGVVDKNKYPLSYTYKQLEGKDLVAHKNGYLEYENTQFCKKGEIYQVITLEKDYLEFIDETNIKHGWDLYDVGEYFYPVDKVKDNLYNPVKNISREKYRRCVKRLSTKLFRSNINGSCLWMHLSKCGKYYYWCEYNSKNSVIYFRGEVDWVESNYDKYYSVDEQVSKEDVIVSFDSNGVVSECKWDSRELGCDEEYVSTVELPEADEYTGSITEWTDKHYDFNYTLTKDDIEKGVIKIDPYFVADQWKLGEKDNSGVIFHILKTCSRYKCKHDEEREIRAIYGQIKRLAEIRGVELK